MSKIHLKQHNEVTEMNFHRLHTVLVLLANGYLEVACLNYDAPEMQRCWVVRRTVDFRHVCWG